MTRSSVRRRTASRLPRALALACVLGLASPLAFADDHADPAMPAQAQADLVDTAVAAGKFETLAAALKAAGLVGTLKGSGPFTVFAPTDAAFAKLPAGTIATLLEPANRDRLVAILTYHVVPGRYPASRVATLDSAATVQGDTVEISVDGDRVMVDDATVVMADVNATNGVIHVIDTVLMPAD
ncbi:MAG TPA: fasciclin domain-containing protein [Xanthomonadaceae bacterium]|nr:fasciclin domain-containing protein [Xanthomonadaceae bacterium]